MRFSFSERWAPWPWAATPRLPAPMRAVVTLELWEAVMGMGREDTRAHGDRWRAGELPRDTLRAAERRGGAEDGAAARGAGARGLPAGGGAGGFAEGWAEGGAAAGGRDNGSSGLRGRSPRWLAAGGGAAGGVAGMGGGVD